MHGIVCASATVTLMDLEHGVNVCKLQTSFLDMTLSSCAESSAKSVSFYFSFNHTSECEGRKLFHT